MRHSRHNFARALTLVEMLVSMSIVTLIIGAVSSAVIVAARAVNPQSSPASTLSSLGEALSRLLEEVSLAIAVTEHTPTTLTFTLPDRTGDSIDDTIRYSWSGVAGDPIVRQFNADAPISVSGGIRLLAFEYDTAMSLEVLPSAQTISTGVELAYFFSPIVSSQLIDPATSISQYVRPSFADGTISWTVTSIDLYVQHTGGGRGRSSFQLELRTPTVDGLPDAEVHDTISVRELDLPRPYAWMTHTFTNAPTLAPGDGICIVASDNSGLVSGEFSLAAQTSSRSFAARGDTATSTWTKYVAMSTPYRIRGTIVTRSPDTTISHTILIRISAELESVSGEIVRGATSVFNHPKLP